VRAGMEEVKDVKEEKLDCVPIAKKERSAGRSSRTRSIAGRKKGMPTKKELAQLGRDWDHCT